MNRQEYWRQQYKARRPGWQDSQTVYRELIGRYVTPQTALLDIGCGHTEFLREVFERTPHTYGLDPDARALEHNTVLRNLVCGSAEAIPFPDAMFDLVTLAWVLEHLEDPQRVFAEIHRVLKPGGRVIFLTPNTWNYNVWIIRAIPNAFHDFLTTRLYGRQEHDTFPTRYRVNSIRTIEKLLTPIGLVREELHLNGDPTYVSFGKPLFHLACGVEKLLDRKPLQRARVHLIGVYRKGGRRSA
ncbi:MAG: methyltransferase domain-containing protein [Candidatus Peregrinibacteria bacterium]|nr:methyltransferase domain-containing protein [Candidatus Peregrinibacteria bacterium]